MTSQIGLLSEWTSLRESPEAGNPNQRLDGLLSRVPILGGERAQIVADYHAETLDCIRDLGPRAREIRRALDRSTAGEVTPWGMVHRFALLGEWSGKKNEPRIHAAAHQAVLMRARMLGMASRSEGDPPRPRRFTAMLDKARVELEARIERAL